MREQGVAAILGNHPDVAHVARVQGQINVIDFMVSDKEDGFRAKLREHLTGKAQEAEEE